MENVMDFYLFLISVIFISLSGVMMPGPLFAVTVAKGVRNRIAGILTSLGHGAVEFPLMFLIYFGFAQLLTSSVGQKAVGFVGGFIMIYLGIRMLNAEKRVEEGRGDSRHGSLIAGILATAANPYFLLWWATIGVALISSAQAFGFPGFLIFTITHWSCDLLWNTFVSITVFKTKRFWTKRVYEIIFGFCFIVLVGFGVWFIISALL